MTPDEPTVASDPAAENEALRARVESLEAEVQMLREKTALTLASAQEKLYWFERWGVDFNSVMSRPQAETARKLMRGLRRIYRFGLQKKRRYLS